MTDHAFPFLTDGPDGELEECLWVPKSDAIDTPEKAMNYALDVVPRDTCADIFGDFSLAVAGVETLVPVETVYDDDGDETHELRGPECVDFDEYTRWCTPEEGEPGTSEWWRIELVEADS